MAERRIDLKYNEYADIVRDIEALHSRGYEKTGSWSLGQICKHLSFYMRGSLEGFPMMLPWIFRVTFGRLALRQALKSSIRKPGGMTAPQSVYPEQPDDAPGVEEIKSLLHRLSVNQGLLHPSALFGNMTPEQWKILHLNHSAHHLSFLVPK
jgi:hypothetical protein